MKRPFKFRVRWSHRFLADSEYYILPDGRLHLKFFKDRDNENDDLQKEFVIQQFSGIYDRVGNPIFEGDIVKIYINEIPLFNTHITFEIGMFGFERGGRFKNLSWYQPTSIKVLGNIFENPELLK